VPSLGAANAVKVEATGGRAHYLDGVSEPYNGGTRHARQAAKNPTGILVPNFSATDGRIIT
jgi:hypothetical protein